MSKISGIAIFFPLFWVMSPVALVMVGNSAGLYRELFFIAIAIGLILAILTVSLLQHPLLTQEQRDAFTNTSVTIGVLPTTTLTLSSYFSLVLLLPTGVLVSAGFTFNETFVYWFPNFAFSFFLLFFILALHLAGQRYVHMAQRLFLTLSLTSLLLIIGFGLINDPSKQIVKVDQAIDFSVILPAVCAALVLFLGHHTQIGSIKRSTLYLSLFLTTLIITLWCRVSLDYVDPVKLSESTIPYLLTGREILGQSGRILVGVAVISGACALVNGLFLISTNLFTRIAERYKITSIIKAEFLRKLYPTLFTVIIATFLAKGLAGSEFIDIYMYGAVLSWMFLIGINCLAATVQLQKIKKSISPHYLFTSFVYPAAALYLAIVHHHSERLGILCFLILLSSFLCSVSCYYLGKRLSLNAPTYSQGDIT